MWQSSKILFCHFSTGNKLAIVNGKYPPLPPNPRYACLHDLVKGCLHVSPVQRLTTATLLERLAAIAESNNFDPREPPRIEVAIKPSLPPRPTPPPPPPSSTSTPAPPPRPNPPVAMPPPSRPTPGVQTAVSKVPATQGAGLFNSLRGGAGSILRNLKDTSSKVMHTVQQSMARTELDASYLTSRILIMPYPADGIESAYRANHVEDVRVFLQSRHPPPAKIQLYNLSRGRPNVARLPGRHVDCSFAYATSESNAPMLFALYQICQDIHQYLNADFNHVVVLYCTVSFASRSDLPASSRSRPWLLARTIRAEVEGEYFILPGWLPSERHGGVHPIDSLRGLDYRRRSDRSIHDQTLPTAASAALGIAHCQLHEPAEQRHASAHQTAGSPFYRDTAGTAVHQSQRRLPALHRDL